MNVPFSTSHTKACLCCGFGALTGGSEAGADGCCTCTGGSDLDGLLRCSDSMGMAGGCASEARAEARIKARRTRIEQRKRAKDDEGKTIGGSHDDGPGQSEGAKQTQQSLAHIDRVKAQSIESVTSIRVQADNAENQRRIREEDNRQNRLRRLQEEAIESGKRNAAVEMRWQE